MNNVSHTGAQEEKQNKRNGVIVTFLIHAGVIALFFFLYLSSPFPPPVSGILINFGTSETGGGETPPESTDPAQEVAAASATPPPAAPEAAKQEIATQEVEPAPAVKKPVERTENPKPVKEVKPEKTKETKPQPEEPKLDPQGLYKGPQSQNDKPGSEGNDKGPSDKGSPTGDDASKSYLGAGLGNVGVDYVLAGRSLLNIPPIEEDYQVSGKVTLKIKVDRNGKVIDASFTQTGSTTTDQTLVRLAKQAALQAKYNPDSKVAEEQFGTITFTFKLK